MMKRFKKNSLVVMALSILSILAVSSANAKDYPNHWPKRMTIAGGVMGASWYPRMIKYSEVLMREIPG